MRQPRMFRIRSVVIKSIIAQERVRKPSAMKRKWFVWAMTRGSFSRRRNHFCMTDLNNINKLTGFRDHRRTVKDDFNLETDLGGRDVNEIFDQIKNSINVDMVRETQAVFQFDVKDHGSYFIDLKNGNGNAGPGKPISKPDAVLSLDVINFKAIFSGELKPNMALMLGKVKIGGNTAQAVKLEKLLPKFRGESD